ncbi:MAG: OmpH family outer membrane protein [Lewinellaceae bacterium]|nr:OmpH family outer membrane protein [Lewinellaceae bacterium]
MKNNTLLIWNIALTLLVAFLLVKQFSGPKPAETTDTTVQTEMSAPLKIVYVNADTLLEKFTDFKAQQEALAKKEKDIDGQLRSRGASLEKEYNAAQEKIQQGLLTPNQIAQEEQRLMAKQQKLMEDQDRLSKELMAETEALNNQLEVRLKSVLTAVRDANGYDYILSYGPGTGVLMVNDTLDVTGKVLDQLNATKEE